MDRTELGKRIKEARLAKKLTQQEVVGTFITRNMLSQIESGIAYPSLKTLEYLSQKLEIPMNELLPAETGRESAANIDELVLAKDLYKKGEWEKAAKAAESLMDGELSDEAYAITAKCLMKMAVEKEERGLLQESAQLARKADALAEEGVYASREVKTAAALLLDKIAREITEKN